MIAFRVADSRRPIFDGTGALLHGGRWNSPGSALIYAAQTYAGALLEVLVHANLGAVPKTHAVITISIPDDIKIELLGREYSGWDAEDRVSSRQFGDQWLREQRTSILLVPSVVLQGRERNVLINPRHPDFVQINSTEAEPVIWDARLFPVTAPNPRSTR